MLVRRGSRVGAGARRPPMQGPRGEHCRAAAGERPDSTM
jgi:hypothetical protein